MLDYIYVPVMPNLINVPAMPNYIYVPAVSKYIYVPAMPKYIYVPAMTAILRDRINNLLTANGDLEREVARLRYAEAGRNNI